MRYKKPSAPHEPPELLMSSNLSSSILGNVHELGGPKVTRQLHHQCIRLVAIGSLIGADREVIVGEGHPPVAVMPVDPVQRAPLDAEAARAHMLHRFRVEAGDKSRLSEAMLEAQVAAGYHRADRFHRFLEVDQDDLLVNPRFPDYVTDRTDRFMVVEVVISSGRPTGTAATIADEAVRLFGERLHLAPQDVLFVFRGGTEPPALSCCADQARGDRGCLSRRSRDQCSHALELTLKGFLRSKGVASWRRMCSRCMGSMRIPRAAAQTRTVSGVML